MDEELDTNSACQANQQLYLGYVPIGLRRPHPATGHFMTATRIDLPQKPSGNDSTSKNDAEADYFGQDYVSIRHQGKAQWEQIKSLCRIIPDLTPTDQ